MSATETQIDLPTEQASVDVQARAVEAAEALHHAREFLDHKVAGGGRIKNPERFDQRRKGLKAMKSVAETELKYLKFLAELERERTLTELEEQLGLAED